MDDEPMWVADRVVALTPGSAITIPETANEFSIKEMLRNFHGHNLTKGNIIKILYHGFSEITQEALNVAAGGIFLYKTPNQAYQLLEDKVLLKLDWAKNQKSKPSLNKNVAFADEGSSNSDTDKIMARMDAKTMKMDAQYKEMQSRSNQSILEYNEDDTPMSREEEAKFMQTFRRTRFYNDYRNCDSNRDNWRLSGRSDYNRDNYQSNSDDKSDIQKQLSGFIKAQQSTNSFVKETFMYLKTKLETTTKNHHASIQNLKAKFDRLADKQSARPSGSLPSNTQPNPKGMPNYGKFLKELVSNKHKLEQISSAFLSDKSFAMIQNKVPPKLGDPRSFLIPCTFSKTFSCNALADLCASINIMPYSLYAKFSLETLKPTKISVRLVDQSFQYPIGIAENMLIEVGKFTFPVDFVILEMEEDSKVPLILGRPFLHTVDAVIQVKQKQLNLRVGSECMIFHIDSAMKHFYSNDDTCFSIDVIDEILEEDFDALLDEGSKILYSIEGTLLEEKLFAEFDEFMAMTIEENSETDSDKEEPPFEKITFDTDYKIKTSLEEPPTDLELIPLSEHLEYVILAKPSFLPVITSSQLSEQNKDKLVSVLKRQKQAFAWKTTDIPGIFGAVLGQKDGKHFHPIYFARKTLNAAQQKYTLTEKELMVVVFAFDKFRPYLILFKTIVYIDNSALRHLFKKQDAKPRLICWILLLQELDIEIKDQKLIPF
ncbi:reverse transcriptase domain-containing protein [Tanacetum coccineum]